jgi:hypothetical protein
MDYFETLKMGQTSIAETLVSYHKITIPGKNPKAFRQQHFWTTTSRKNK